MDHPTIDFLFSNPGHIHLCKVSILHDNSVNFLDADIVIIDVVELCRLEQRGQLWRKIEGIEKPRDAGYNRQDRPLGPLHQIFQAIQDRKDLHSLLLMGDVLEFVEADYEDSLALQQALDPGPNLIRRPVREIRWKAKCREQC